ncbi:MAG: hypothetical protein ACD_40C00323G0008, partial [uncultured bacterium]
MKTTLRTLKNNQKELRAFAAILGVNAINWPLLSRSLVTSEQGSLISADQSVVPVTPLSLLNTPVSADFVAKLYRAIFQPETSLLSSRVMLSLQFNSLCARLANPGSFPTLSKGVSYPSSLQRGGSTKTLSSDNVWLLDLFSGGAAYLRAVESTNQYYVVDTTIYEGWNRFTDPEINQIFTSLPTNNPGQTIVGRFLSILRSPPYQYVLTTCRVRGAYLSAIAQVLKLPPVVKMESVLLDPIFLRYLDQVLAVVNPLQAFCYEGDTNARDFAPFVYAEEMYLREKYQVDSCTGPLREDLPLNFSVLNLCRQLNSLPTPIIWYTRPDSLPPLTFSSSLPDVLTVLTTNPTALSFAKENLLKLGLVTTEQLASITPTQLANILYLFMRQVETLAQQRLK